MRSGTFDLVFYTVAIIVANILYIQYGALSWKAALFGMVTYVVLAVAYEILAYLKHWKHLPTGRAVESIIVLLLPH
ncbi:hypothetical protein A2673_00875 [Candidatus Kaiserbacteria bacterium RIFCSPHIGHO2_01_FULL_50_13]|uniref:Uncharacterized protein n=1 Tax=Candidatus Kaiserbacteria bacterium RIFCSPLOWO2_01_FULL_50_24 TaxID=1798507 RepID=A0A1F6EMU6_9BACT|nr:MAG: hypothetical protein A2673_00875 [Candidatus Kaiserbacteria bacterium RIFCSPHIGHO2_01_FULL_50_13]OGG74969.1 MAG: hypothetical protein A3A34_04090 [Candidatus Kaiserbacteria bacterium RIFCSPLOWO2_01_FULL_50_24]OGG81771.1 MAG: hypothetical protein A3H74_01165 [Candidatus Kaiserbacteria bacterium RIFCSPLOWO2_02_FULL_51_13]